MSVTQLTQAGIIGHGAAALAFFLLTLFVAYAQRRNAFSGMLMAFASLSTAAWGAVVAYDFGFGQDIGPVAEVLEIIRSGGWMILMLGLLSWMPPVQRSSWGAAIVGACALLAVLVVIGDMSAVAAIPLGTVLIAGHLMLALIGLGLVENLFRNSTQARRWNIKFLCFGVGALFAYDFYLYADALLFRHLDSELYVARGVTNLLVVPFLAVYASRDRKAGPQIALSRRFAFYSATVMGGGLYLVTMAAAGFYVRRFGGSWSGFLQAIFFFGTVLLVLVPLSSGSFRAYFRIFVEKSFFKYKYDYRGEWLRFIQTMSLRDSEISLRTRVIQAVADIVDTPDGGIWLRRGDRCEMTASWNLSRWGLHEAEATIAWNGPFMRFLERTNWVINLDELAERPERYEGLSELPDWLKRSPRAWLILPLLHHDGLLGFMMLGQPRAPRQLSWEDFDILKTVARQVASYLAEQMASEALNEARQFEAFNKRFAFVVHDIKNLASQLSLILSNTEKHRGNLQFQDDVIETVRQSVDKMNRMLTQLRAQPERAAPPNAVELGPLLRKIVETREQIGPMISLDLQAETVTVAADEDRLKAVVEHLVQNAVDAVGADGRIKVRLAGEGKMAVVEIEDNGPGMDADFVRDKLFHPFATTKGLGYGIGVYESRDFATSLGGQLEVTSQLGRGTIMRMRLPAVVS